jgi:hypothetical protein
MAGSSDAADADALMQAACKGDVVGMEVLLHASADPAAMMQQAQANGVIPLVMAAAGGHLAAMRVLLDHPLADPEAMIMRYDALVAAASNNRVDAMRLLLDHPSAHPSAMLTLKYLDGFTVLMSAAGEGHVDAMRLLLDHPSADPEAMMAQTSHQGFTATRQAAMFAAVLYGAYGGRPNSSYKLPPCAPLLFLLRRTTVDPQPSDAQQAYMSKHMTEVMEALSLAPRSKQLLYDTKPDDTRDECVRLLLEHGARGYDSSSPVVSRIVCALAQQALVQQRTNEAVVGMVSKLVLTPGWIPGPSTAPAAAPVPRLVRVPSWPPPPTAAQKAAMAEQMERAAQGLGVTGADLARALGMGYLFPEEEEEAAVAQQ